MKSFICVFIPVLLFCFINLSCENIGQTLSKKNPFGIYQTMKELKDTLSIKVVDNKYLYDSLLLRKEKNDSLIVQDIEKMNDKVQLFLTITAKCDSVAMNCGCRKPYENLKPTLSYLYSSMLEINQSFEQVSETNKLEVKIAGEIMQENKSQEEWEKILFHGLDTMTTSVVLLQQKVDVLVKEKEILEKLIQQQNETKTNHQN